MRRDNGCLRLMLAIAAGALVASACASGTTSSGGSATAPPETTASVSEAPSTSAASPTPSGTAAELPPQPGTVTAEEDFSDPADHRFGIDGGAAASNTVTGGQYRMVLTKDDAPYGQLIPVENEPLTVSVALDMSMGDSDSAAWMGPVCFFEQKFGFSLKVHPDGAYELVQVSVQGQDVATLASGQTDPLEPGSPIRLRLDCTWGMDVATATAWVGSTRVGPAGDVEPSDNLLRWWAGTGFWAMTPSAPMTVLVDNAVLTQVDQ